ncbi:HTH-type transcriptional regulator [Actinobacillus seminis]|uniref:HTH-type transcriptional regulator n=2 Tax=Actinobacillus seminis TaxID=722 RepID=A0A380VDL0_9PAST|nr:HTH-type transcriptional regulator [Actinobacillus seminis]
MKYLLNDVHIVLFSVFVWSWKMNRISEFRKSINLTQQEFSARLNLTQGALAHYENGRRTPTVKMARLIVDTLNENGASVSIDEVFPADN